MPSVTMVGSLLLLLLSHHLCTDRVHGAMQQEEQHAQLHPHHLSFLRTNASASSSLGPEMHIAFSTDCRRFMDWQSLVLFHSARSVHQKGPITRIASGCSESKMKELVELYAKLYPGYRVHFTPNYGEMAGFKYSNKPMGVDHWLRHADPPVGPDTIVALLDSDMILLRPITASILAMDSLRFARRRKKFPMRDVTKGKPAGAEYYIRAPWTHAQAKNFSKLETCGPDSPCLYVKERFALNHFTAGPPLLMHRDDLVRVASTWSRFMPSVLRRYENVLTDMYAYAMSAAHEQLPHLQLTNLLVSNVKANAKEGWRMVDRLDNVCATPVDGIFFPGQPLPSVIHYCQLYPAKEMYFSKYRPIMNNIVACDHALLQEPPPDLAHINTANSTQTEETIRIHNRNAFTICTIYRSINAALIHYKQNMCDMRTANMKKSGVLTRDFQAIGM